MSRVIGALVMDTGKQRAIVLIFIPRMKPACRNFWRSIEYAFKRSKHGLKEVSIRKMGNNVMGLNNESK